MRRLTPRRRKREEATNSLPRQNPAILFDLDGTLLDSNYEHVLAWRLALRHEGVEVPNAFLHRCIGMRGELLIKAAYKEIGRSLSTKTKEKLEKLHKKYFGETLASVKPLPGSVSSSQSLVTGGRFPGRLRPAVIRVPCEE